MKEVFPPGKKSWGRNKEFHTSGRGLRAAFILRSTIFVPISNVFGNKTNFNLKRSLNTPWPLHTSEPSEPPPPFFSFFFWSFHFASAFQLQRCSRCRVITSVSVSRAEKPWSSFIILSCSLVPFVPVVSKYAEKLFSAVLEVMTFLAGVSKHQMVETHPNKGSFSPALC